MTPLHRSLAASVMVATLLVLGAVLLAGAGTAAQETNFEVEMDAPEGVDAGGDLTVSVTVTNLGPGNDTQDIVLTDSDGTELDAQSVTLDDGESTQIELTWSGVPEDARTINPEVRSQTDADAAVVTVRWAEFEIDDLSPESETIEANGSFSVEAQIRNLGTVEAQQNVTLTIAGSEYAVKENVTIPAEEFTTARFLGIEPELEPGTYTYTVETDDDSRSGTLTVKEPPEAEFHITDIEGEYADGTATVDAVIENQGNVEDTQQVTISVDGEIADERLLTLGVDESKTVTFTHQPESVPINVTVETEAPDAASVRVGEANIEFGPQVAEVTPAVVDLGDEISVTYTASGENLVETRLIVYGPDGAVAYEKQVAAGIERTVAFSQSDLSPYNEGEYDVALAVTDEFGRTDTHRLTDAFSATAEIEDGPSIGELVPEFVQADETLFVNYTATGRNIESVHLKLIDPGGEVRLDQTVPQGVDLQHAIEPGDVSELPGGLYDVTLEMHDAFGTVESTTREEAVEFGRQYNPDDGNFGADVYTTTAGDFVEIDVSLNEVDEAYILLGDGTSSDTYGLGGPLDVLHVSGSSSFVVNTRLFGTDRPGEDVYITQDGSVTSYAHDLGASEPPQGVFEDLRFETIEGEQVATNLSDFRRHVHVSSQLRPLQPGTYAMTLGAGDSIVIREDGVPDPRFPLDRAELELSKPELGNLSLYRVPPGNADELAYQVEEEPAELTPDDLGALRSSGIQTNNITLGERVLVGFEATGIWGTFLDTVEDPSAVSGGAEPRLITPAEFREFLDRPEGVDLTVSHANPERNTAVTGLDLFNATTDDVSILLDPYFGDGSTEMGEIYLLMDTRPPDPFEEQPEADQRFVLNVSYQAIQGDRYTFADTEIGDQPDPFDPEQEQFPYFFGDDETQMRSTSFTINEQFLEYDRTTLDGRPIVAAEPDSTISGRTNYMPGDRPIRIVIDVRNNTGRTVEIQDVPIGENGTFSVQPNLGSIDPDSNVWIEFWAYEELVDERQLALFDDPAEFTTFEITDLQTQTLVREDTGPITNVTAIVENRGSLTGVATVELLIDGQVVGNKTVEIERGRNGAVSFPEATAGLAPGQHTVEVRTKDDLEGTLIDVQAVTTVFEIQSFSLSGSPTTNATDVVAAATVRNTGTVRGAKPVELLVDGEVVDEVNRTLLADEDLTAIFEDAIGDLEPGNYTVTLRTPDDEQTRPLLVQEPEETGEAGGDDGDGGESGGGDDAGGDESDDSSDEAPSDGGDSAPGAGGIFAVGAGSRAVVGGTAIVGAVYVLGYWV
jgi:hypothetical protein